jgi:glycerophosphoryl diester phosphodiesterase
VLDLARGRIKLNVELKLNGHKQRLEQRVASLIADNHFEQDCVVTSLEYASLREIKRLDARLRTGHIVSAKLGDVTRLKAVDFLSLQAGQVTEAAMRAYRRAGLGVHVWTVNDRRTMLTMIMHRVDNIITDKPTLLISLQQEIAELSDTELLLLAVSVRLGDFGAVSHREL